MDDARQWERELSEIRALASAADKLEAAVTQARNTGWLAVQGSDAAARIRGALARNAGDEFPLDWFRTQAAIVLENLRALEESDISRAIIDELENALASYVRHRGAAVAAEPQAVGLSHGTSPLTAVSRLIMKDWLKRLQSGWKKASVGVRASVVGGMFVLAAAIVSSPIVIRYLQKRPDLVVQTIAPVSIDTAKGIRIVLSNNSDVSESLNRAEVEFSQSGVPIGTAGWRTYRLTGQVKTTGSIIGSANTSYDALKGQTITFPASGSIKVYATGRWELRIAFDLYEELEPNAHFSLAVLLPEALEIPDDSEMEGILLGPNLKQYVSGDSKKTFQLMRYLKDIGETGLTATITYGNGHTAKYQGSITFQ